jgi:hypothetical protein
MQPRADRLPPVLDLDKVRTAQLETSPYDYFIVPDFIRDEWKERLIQNYPTVGKPGSFPLSTVRCHRDFRQLIDELNSESFRQVIEKKFSLDLKGKPTMFTVRGQCRLKDGKVHTDTESKIITVLLYMNPAWESQGGKLRILRSNNLEDVASEISPDIGTLLVFKRSDSSFHGHLPFEGNRRVIQMNWVTHRKFVEREQKRHKWSAFMKMLGLSY